MKQININIEDGIFDEANSIIDDLGMDVEMVVKILLKRISKEKKIDFLFQQSMESKNTMSIEAKAIFNDDNMQSDKMTKSRAVRLFHNEGIEVKGKVIFSSKNRSADNYWSNPPLYALDEDISLILNDTINKQLYLFFIPAYSFTKSQFIARNDRPELIDMQIKYNDSFFEDNRSGVRFANFLKNIINY